MVRYWGMGVRAIALAMLVTLTAAAGAEHPDTGGRDPEAERVELQCLNCVYLDGQHALQVNYPELCEGENCEQNNCRGCGETSLCHDYPMGGPCHVECECDTQHEDEEDPELAQTREDAVGRRDIAQLAAMVARGGAVELNAERGALQLVDCRGVVLHIALQTEVLHAVNGVLAEDR